MSDLATTVPVDGGPGKAPSLLQSALLAVTVVLAMMLMSTAVQRALMYEPDTRRVDPAAAGLPEAREEELVTPDGQRLIAWWVPAASGRPTLVYLHGNGGGLAQRAERMARFARAGLGVFMLSYRGFSGSTGLPSESANVADALLAYDHVRAKGIEERSIVLMGESLGTGVATQVAVRRSAAGLALDAPYTSIVDVALYRYPFAPLGWFMTDRYDTMAVIGRVQSPVLIVHGEQDRTVPLAMGRRVFEAIRSPKRMLTYPQAGHSNHWRWGSMDAVIAWALELGHER